MAQTIPPQMTERAVLVDCGALTLEGDLTLPDTPLGVVLFAHGSGSSRFSPRNRHVARILNEAGLATMLVDLLTKDEERSDAQTGHLRFDIGLLAERLTSVADWLTHQPDTQALPTGCFGASTGAAAALVTAAHLPDRVNAVVSRGGRPDLAGAYLPCVRAATLLIVGGDDQPVIPLNREALSQLNCEKELVIVPGATHLFEQPGTLDTVAQLARQWFGTHLSTRGSTRSHEGRLRKRPGGSEPGTRSGR
jgi:putative phosphoribosyl transferase